MSATVVKFQSKTHLKRKAEVWERFLKLRKANEMAARRMWAGTLVMHFTDDELALIPDLLCPMDYKLLKQAGRRTRR